MSESNSLRPRFFSRPIVLALFGLIILSGPAFGFGWGIPLPPVPPLPGDPNNDPAPPLNELPPVDPVDPIGNINNGDDPPPNPPGGINDAPEPATIIAGLVGASALGIAQWWRRRRVKPEA